MTTNLETFKEDLRRLIDEGKKIYYDFAYKYLDEEEKKKIEETDKLSFTTHYQHWYSESLRVLQQLLPDRVEEFNKYYRYGKRKDLDLETYSIQDALLGISITWGNKVVDGKAAVNKLWQQILILASAKKVFESSLFKIQQVLQADLFDSELDASKELNKKGFTRGAGAIAGVVLEHHLSQVCRNHNLAINKKNPTISYYNQLLKDNDVIEIQKWNFINHLASLRNLCDHKKEREPIKEDVLKLIEGVNEIIKTTF